MARNVVKSANVRRQGGLSAPQTVTLALAFASAVTAFLFYTAISIIIGGDTVVLGFVGPDMMHSAPAAAGWVLVVWCGFSVACIFRCLRASNPARFGLMMLMGGIGVGTLILGLQAAVVDTIDLTALLRLAVALIAAAAALLPVFFLSRRVSSTWFNL